MRTRVGLFIAIASVGVAHAQVIDFESNTNGQTGVMFRVPNFSGSTSGNLVTPANGGANIGRISDAAPVNPFAPSSTRAFEAQWSFLDTAASRWLRLTTNAASLLPNPTIDFTQTLSFDVYTTVSLYVALGVRETGTSANVFENGGTTGAIEFVSNGGLVGAANAGAPQGQLIAANTWTRLTYDFAALNANPSGNVRSFSAGNGLIDGTKGTLEMLAFTSAGNVGPYQVFVDNFTVAPVPEPGTMAALGLGALALMRRRRSK